MGRKVAGATFLDGFVRYAEVDRYVGVAHGGEAAAIFRRRIAEITAGDPVRSARPVATLATTALGGMAEIGAVYLPDPQTARFAVGRRQAGQRAARKSGVSGKSVAVRVVPGGGGGLTK